MWPLVHTQTATKTEVFKTLPKLFLCMWTRDMDHFGITSLHAFPLLFCVCVWEHVSVTTTVVNYQFVYVWFALPGLITRLQFNLAVFYSFASFTFFTWFKHNKLIAHAQNVLFSCCCTVDVDINATYWPCMLAWAFGIVFVLSCVQRSFVKECHVDIIFFFFYSTDGTNIGLEKYPYMCGQGRRLQKIWVNSNLGYILLASLPKSEKIGLFGQHVKVAILSNKL